MGWLGVGCDGDGDGRGLLAGEFVLLLVDFRVSASVLVFSEWELLGRVG